LLDLSFSPPNEENGVSLLNLGFATTAPATPPATPAVVHYRGTSFDVVNPHDSLLLHDIETPLRDSDSPEYYPTRSSAEPLFESEMAPPRPLFGDLEEAYRSIAKRPDGPPGGSQLSLPTPPNPAVVSPNSAKYSSGYDNDLAVSPLAIRKNTDSRFSLIKNLTRKITKRGAKETEIEAQELQEIPVSPVEKAAHHLEGEFPRSLVQNYRSAPQFTPNISSIENERGASARISMSMNNLPADHYYDNESLYPSSSIYTADGGPGYAASDKRKTGTTDLYRYSVNPSEYRSDIAGHLKYAFADSRPASKHSSKLASTENSRPYGANGVDRADTISKFVNLYEEPEDTSLTTVNAQGQDDSDQFTTHSGAYQDPSRPPMIHASSGLSKFEFNFDETDDQPGNTGGISNSHDNSFYGIQGRMGNSTHSRKPTIGHTPSAPPHVAPPMPVRPSYESEEHCQPPSDVFSGTSSYSDTRQLLQLSQPMSTALVRTPRKPKLTGTQTIRETLEPSSSYSQSEGNAAVNRQGPPPSSSYSQTEASGTPTTPNDALQQAEQIFDEARRSSTKESISGIPMIWTRKSSGNLKLRRKSLAASFVTSDDASNKRDSMPSKARGETPDPDDDADWETIPPSPAKDKRLSALSNDDSIADYSSDEDLPRLPGLYNSHAYQMDGRRIPTSSSLYRHPNPLPRHDNPFSSSPPPLGLGDRLRSFPSDGNPGPSSADTRKSTTVPIFRTRLSYRNHQDHYKPVLNPFAQLSDKETQELLNSGPNEDILYEGDNAQFSSGSFGRSGSLEPHSSTSFGAPRENTFDKFTILGPKANLTGTPNGTNMREAGSSLADTSDPGEMWSSSPPARSLSRPFFVPEALRVMNPDRRRSTLIKETSSFSPERERTKSTNTLFPSHYTIHQNCIPSPSSSSYAGSIMSNDRHSRQFHSSPPSGRPAVAGMTKLRQMVLAPDNATVSSGHSTRTSHFMGRPQSDIGSSMHTFSPLRSQQSSVAPRTNLPTEHSPHLLYAERVLSVALEHEQKKKSKIIFFCFCLLPPLLLLYTFGRADWIIAIWSKGEIAVCHPQWKRRAKWVGSVLTVLVTVIIIAPIMAAHTAGIL
jgi:hypothetical protein